MVQFRHLFLCALKDPVELTAEILEIYDRYELRLVDNTFKEIVVYDPYELTLVNYPVVGVVAMHTSGYSDAPRQHCRKSVARQMSLVGKAKGPFQAAQRPKRPE